MDTAYTLAFAFGAGLMIFGLPTSLFFLIVYGIEQYLDRKDAIRYARSRHPAGRHPYPHSNVKVM